MERLTVQILMVAGLILAVMIHEVAHGWVALLCGDPTARNQGRLTLNPAPHVDPMGSIIIPAVLALTGSGLVFGWAKPVPVNLRRCRNPEQALWMVSLAGPLSNLVQALIATGLLWLLLDLSGRGVPVGHFSVFLYLYIQTNIVLMTFNLIPIPPLDGSRILLSVLPDRGRMVLLSMERYSLLILAILLMSRVVSPFIGAVLNGYMRLVGLG